MRSIRRIVDEYEQLTDELTAERDEFREKLRHLEGFATELTHIPEYQAIGLRMRQIIAPTNSAPVDD